MTAMVEAHSTSQIHAQSGECHWFGARKPPLPIVADHWDRLVAADARVHRPAKIEKPWLAKEMCQLMPHTSSDIIFDVE